MTTALNEKINGIVSDGGIAWGCTPTIMDLSESDAIANCHLRKVDPCTLTEKLWPLMSVHLTGDRDKIKCAHGYTIDYECGFLILLYRLSRPRRVRYDMEKTFGIRRSRLSEIIQTFFEALYKVAFPYFNNPFIWHSRMPYFIDLIQNKTDEVAENIWDSSTVQFAKHQGLCIINESSTQDSKNVMVRSSNQLWSLMDS